MRIPDFAFCPFVAVLLLASGSAFGQAAKELPPQRPLATTKAVVDEHFDALNHCDWKRLVQQYSDDARVRDMKVGLCCFPFFVAYNLAYMIR